MTKIKARLIIEILGRPAEHIKESLTSLVLRLDTEKGVTILEKTIHDPVPVKESKDLFTTFAEVSAEFDSVPVFLGVVFAYLPSNIEVIEPSEISITNTDLSDLASRITQRIHSYDSIAKKMIADRDLILKKLYEVAPHLFKKNEQIPQSEQKPKKEKPKKAKKKKRR